MGNYFTSLLIQNKDRLSQSSFLKLFKSEMKKNGYEVCKEDSAELSYTIRYGINWATIYSEKYVPGGSDVRNDAAQFAKILGTFCLNTAVIDSDCAIIDLYGKGGNKMDMIIMGRADDYFGNDIPEPSEKIWTAFLADGYTWEQFCSIRNGDYVFVEEGLELLANTLEIDEKSIMFTGEESDKNTVCLSFRTAEAKKGKKLTLKTAFIEVLGEALEPLGFKKINSKHPYYIRVVNGEILNIITFDRDSQSEFGIFGGIATLYRKTIDFDQDVFNNLSIMNDTAQFYFYSEPYEKNKTFFNRSYPFAPNDNDLIKQSFLEALSHTKQYIIQVMDRIISLRDCVDYFMVYQSQILQILIDEEDLSGYNEGLLYFKIDDHSDMTHEFTKYIDCHKRFTNYDTLFNHAEAYRKEQIKKRDEIYNNNEKYQQIIAELSLRKDANIKKLRHYGVIISE